MKPNKKKKYAQDGLTGDSPIKGNINFNPSNNPYENAYKPLPNYTDDSQQLTSDDTQSSINSSQIVPISTTPKKRKGINLSGSFNTADITAGVIAGANMIIPDFYKPEDNVNRMQRAYNPYPMGDNSQAIYKDGGMLYSYNGQHAANGLTLTNADRDAWEAMQADAYRMGFLGSDRSKTPGMEFIKSHGIDPAKLPLYQQDFQDLSETDPSRISYSSEGLSDVDNFYGHKTAQQRYRKYEVQRNNETPIKLGTNQEAASELTSLAKNDLSGFDERYKQEMSKVYNPDTGMYEAPTAKDGKWIQKAVNPKHKGYCTPMTKSTCTPRRKALAKTFKKHHGFHKAEEGDTMYAYDGDHYMENGGELYAYSGQPMADSGMSVEGNSYNMLSPFTGKLGGRYHSNGGTDIAFGGQVIEAEKDETFTKDKHGNLVILGNMKVPGTSMTFKKAGELVGEQEANIQKINNKATKALDNSTSMIVNNNLLQTNNATVFTDAVKQRSKMAQSQKDALISIQNNMLDAAEKLGIEPKKISKQLEAKMGKVMKKQGCADCGYKMLAEEGFRFDKASPILTETPPIIPGVNTWNEYSIKGAKPKEEILPLPFANTLQPFPVINNSMFPTPIETYNPQTVNVPEYTPIYNNESFVDEDKKSFSYTKYNKIGIPNILPELSLLADRPDQVTGQQYNPALYTPYQVSYQDRRNEAQATFNALQRNLINNPAAVSNLAAQKYMQENAINAEEFRTNQTIQNDIINKNVGILNDAERVNLSLADTQMDRQAKAKAITKDRKYQALASIANKFDQKRAENRNIQLVESMSNYRFNPKTGKVEYVGAPYQFTENSGQNTSSQNTRRYKYDADGNLLGWEETDQSDSKDKIDASKAKKAAKSKFGGLFSK